LEEFLTIYVFSPSNKISSRAKWTSVFS